MTNFDHIKKARDNKEHYVGARITKDLKEWLSAFCEGQGIKSVSALIEALLIDLKKSNEGDGK